MSARYVLLRVCPKLSFFSIAEPFLRASNVSNKLYSYALKSKRFLSAGPHVPRTAGSNVTDDFHVFPVSHVWGHTPRCRFHIVMVLRGPPLWSLSRQMPVPPRPNPTDG